MVQPAQNGTLLSESSKKDFVSLSDQCNLRDNGPPGPEDLEREPEEGIE
jgi:hypothetical protein